MAAIRPITGAEKEMDVCINFLLRIQVTLLATREMMLAMTRIALPTTRATVGRTSKRSGHSARRYSSGRWVHLYTDSVCAANVRAVIPQQRASTVRPWRTALIKFSLREKNRPARLAASDSNPQAGESGFVLPFAIMMGAAAADGFDGHFVSNTQAQDENSWNVEVARKYEIATGPRRQKQCLAPAGSTKQEGQRRDTGTSRGIGKRKKRQDKLADRFTATWLETPGLAI